MINLGNYANENKTQHNVKWPYIPDHPYRTLIIGDSGSGKANALLNVINNQPDTDKIYYDDPKAFTEYSNDMQDVYKNIDEYNIDNERIDCCYD